MISGRVVNASPLIFLTDIGLRDVLQQPGVPVLVPDVVLSEIGGFGPGGSGSPCRPVSPRGWWIVPIPAIPDSVLVWDLDAGESAVLAVALGEPDSMAILTTSRARRRLRRGERLNSGGTLGLVLVAKQQGLIAAVRPVLEQLKQAGDVYVR